MRSWKGLLVFFALVALAAGLGASAAPDAWYGALHKPWFNPPNWIFGPVWTLLYVLMAIAAWRVFRKRGAGIALTLWIIQLACNAAWSPIFFGAHQLGWALADIIVLWALLAATTVLFWRIDRPAGALMVPYWVWVTFAAVLNASIWNLN